MHTTSPSLLEQLREPDNRLAWDRFVALYTPLLFQWARRLQVQPSDVENLVQDVLLALLHAMSQFEYQLGGRFRGWLWTVMMNKFRAQRRQRSGRPLELANADLVDQQEDEAGVPFDEVEYRQYLVRRAMQVMKADFEPATWQAFWEYVIVGRPVAEVAAELHISTNAVHLARARVLRRLRQELAGLLE